MKSDRALARYPIHAYYRRTIHETRSALLSCDRYIRVPKHRAIRPKKFPSHACSLNRSQSQSQAIKHQGIKGHSTTDSINESKICSQFGIFHCISHRASHQEPSALLFHFSSKTFLIFSSPPRTLPSFSIHCLSASSLAFLTTTSSSSHR